MIPPNVEVLVSANGVKVRRTLETSDTLGIVDDDGVKAEVQVMAIHPEKSTPMEAEAKSKFESACDAVRREAEDAASNELQKLRFKVASSLRHAGYSFPEELVARATRIAGEEAVERFTRRVADGFLSTL